MRATRAGLARANLDAALPDRPDPAAAELAEQARRHWAQFLPGPRAQIGALIGRVVAGYVPIGSEIHPDALLDMLERFGAQRVYPRMEADSHLSFRVGDRASLEPGPHAIAQPSKDAPALRPDLILLPLLAFDRAGRRLGYGGGWYDRTLARLMSAPASRPRCVGLAYAGQEVAMVPALVHDIAMDAILTPAGLVEPTSLQ